ALWQIAAVTDVVMAETGATALGRGARIGDDETNAVVLTAPATAAGREFLAWTGADAAPGPVSVAVVPGRGLVAVLADTAAGRLAGARWIARQDADSDVLTADEPIIVAVGDDEVVAA